MATDAQVKEIALLKEYANRLDGFKDAILGGCMVLQNKAEAILDNLQNESNITDNNLQENQKLASRTINVYEDIIRRYRLSSTSSSLLGSTPEEVKQSIKEIELCTSEIKESSSTLLKLINDILFLSRLDARMIEFKYKPTDFASIFETRCQTAVFRSQKPGVNYVYDNPYNSLIVDIDEQNLGIVIDQVVKRAVENTTSGQVRCRYDYTGEHLIIAVQDTSNGISEENLKHIFDRFTPTDEKSTGLGMSICQELVSQMGGKITVKSVVGEGTIVWISVPCASSKIDRK